MNVWNLSETAVTSVDCSYSADGYAGSGHMDFVEPVKPDLVNKAQVRLLFEPLSALGSHFLALRIDKVNGVLRATHERRRGILHQG